MFSMFNTHWFLPSCPLRGPHLSLGRVSVGAPFNCNHVCSGALFDHTGVFVFDAQFLVILPNCAACNHGVLTWFKASLFGPLCRCCFHRCCIHVMLLDVCWKLLESFWKPLEAGLHKKSTFPHRSMLGRISIPFFGAFRS